MEQRKLMFRLWDGKQMINPSDILGDIRDEFILSLMGDVFFVYESNNGQYCPTSLEVKSKSNITIMQSTGLFDKNNNPIYEGDLIRYKIEIGTAITSTITCEVCKSKYGWYPFTDKLYCMDNAKDIEVVGNIYETPNYLTTQQ